MYNILTLNNISKAGLDRFSEEYVCGNDVSMPDAIMVRSASMHDMEINSRTVAIARAGAGVNNIPIDECSKTGVVVFNTPGANANAVKELVLAGLLLSSRKIVKGIEFAKTLKGNGDNTPKLIEKGKSQFAGPELRGKRLGVIGLGAIGILVANSARALGMDVYGYDPYISVNSAWGLSRTVKHAQSLDDIYSNCDYITVHVPLCKDTREMINKDAIDKMKDKVRLLNFSRAGLVDSKAILSGIEEGKIACYVTDFATDDLLCVDSVIAIPHLGASTPESEENCAKMAADELIDYLENGNIKNSVNLPEIFMPRIEGLKRLCVIHKNIPNMLNHITGALSSNHINIDNMLSKSKKDMAYAILDISSEVPTQAIESLAKIDGIIRIRLI